MTKTPELLAPAGGWECLRAAVANGADAVFFGLPRFNARMRADNFTEEELPEVTAFCHRHGVKTFVTLNTLIFTSELDDVTDYLRLLNRSGVDALIVQDIGLVRLATEIVPELPIHASTQMTLTSPQGVEVARDLGITRSVLARELSLREMKRFDRERMPLEVFVHGALCVAYSGQCLTSESLGQRSANRGECAQACRMPYELIVDGALRDLGDRRYLLSPQDLAAVNDIPKLVEAGIVSFKIEGRLKSPEYVAAVCQVYRKAIDAALAGMAYEADKEDRYQLEMSFSRGLYSGWIHGVNHQELVHARFGKKRGPFVGRIAEIGSDYLGFTTEVPLKPGDGIVFDTGEDTNKEQGGRIFDPVLANCLKASDFVAIAADADALTFGQSMVTQTNSEPKTYDQIIKDPQFGLPIADAIYAAIVARGSPGAASLFVQFGIDLSLDQAQTGLDQIATSIPSLATACAQLKLLGKRQVSVFASRGVTWSPVVADITFHRAANLGKATWQHVAFDVVPTLLSQGANWESIVDTVKGV